MAVGAFQRQTILPQRRQMGAAGDEVHVLGRREPRAEQAKAVMNPRERDEWPSLHGRYLALARGIETRRRGSPKVPSFPSQSPVDAS
jgi:hypothetical protein